MNVLSDGPDREALRKFLKANDRIIKASVEREKLF
jgi:hypothetical protein